MKNEKRRKKKEERKKEKRNTLMPVSSSSPSLSSRRWWFEEAINWGLMLKALKKDSKSVSSNGGSWEKMSVPASQLGDCGSQNDEDEGTGTICIAGRGRRFCCWCCMRLSLSSRIRRSFCSSHSCSKSRSISSSIAGLFFLVLAVGMTSSEVNDMVRFEELAKEEEEEERFFLFFFFFFSPPFMRLRSQRIRGTFVGNVG